MSVCGFKLSVSGSEDMPEKLSFVLRFNANYNEVKALQTRVFASAIVLRLCLMRKCSLLSIHRTLYVILCERFVKSYNVERQARTSILVFMYFILRMQCSRAWIACLILKRDVSFSLKVLLRALNPSFKFRLLLCNRSFR